MLEACTWKNSQGRISFANPPTCWFSSYKSLTKVSTRKVTSSHAWSTPLIIWVEFDILPLVILPCPCQLIFSSCWGLNGQYKQNHFFLCFRDTIYLQNTYISLTQKGLRHCKNSFWWMGVNHSQYIIWLLIQFGIWEWNISGHWLSIFVVLLLSYLKG